jgi:hypothetical protein
MKAACRGPITICYMVNDRFIQLLTKELCEELTDAEREELSVFLRENEYSNQRELLKEYWERDKTAYEANTSMFKKVLEKIKTAESLRPRNTWPSLKIRNTPETPPDRNIPTTPYPAEDGRPVSGQPPLPSSSSSSVLPGIPVPPGPV